MFARGSGIIYYGNVGVGDLDFFRRDDVRALARAFNADGRVYLNRWSDQTYYVLLLALFAAHEAVGDLGLRWAPQLYCHKACRRGGHHKINVSSTARAGDQSHGRAHHGAHTPLTSPAGGSPPCSQPAPLSV